MDNLLNTEPSQQDLVKRISIMRGNSEPEQGTTEEPAPVDVSEENPDDIEEVETNNEELEVETKTIESEELESEELEVAAEDNIEDEFFLLDGEEINVNDVKKWRDDGLRQQDYTRKTQAAAEETKAAKAKQQELDQVIQTLNSDIEQIEVLLKTEDDSIDWERLREDDLYEYTDKKEAMEAKRELIKNAKLKIENEKSKYNTDYLAQEQTKLFDAIPDWLDEKGQTTKVFDNDMTVINTYLQDNNWTKEEVEGITNHKHWLTILDAAKFRQSKSKESALAKKVEKAPRVTKPTKKSATNVSGIDQQIAEAAAKLKRTGREQDAAELMKLKRQKTRQ